jgi:hypothetical protein
MTEPNRTSGERRAAGGAGHRWLERRSALAAVSSGRPERSSARYYNWMADRIAKQYVESGQIAIARIERQRESDFRAGPGILSLTLGLRSASLDHL